METIAAGELLAVDLLEAVGDGGIFAVVQLPADERSGGILECLVIRLADEGDVLKAKRRAVDIVEGTDVGGAAGAGSGLVQPRPLPLPCSFAALHDVAAVTAAPLNGQSRRLPRGKAASERQRARLPACGEKGDRDWERDYK